MSPAEQLIHNKKLKGDAKKRRALAWPYTNVKVIYFCSLLILLPLVSFASETSEPITLLAIQKLDEWGHVKHSDYRADEPNIFSGRTLDNREVSAVVFPSTDGVGTVYVLFVLKEDQYIYYGLASALSTVQEMNKTFKDPAILQGLFDPDCG